ncbi:NAD(P)/FAD-dependent oxidoreductase [Kutzneria buriramensis]|uniref:NADPH-dependent 2,4-dienoyl-CoA reductase/sulfur reductase-like enzyme n=1 Tax=Kutzneria buriramensis TaxID=1045776 RepID=A0A3E0HIH5_9PSEU|nr:FAD-dependent oxidoreductase [Kutzneria buriramensis]REH46192.1 NADPH-dependent 2,4-dienoyl-CoA reductase/sulfur reductase-like enzyme [Kutzneria buriramensis]
MTPGRIVVVGASLAGLRSAESLRANGFTGELVIIGDERHEPYDRPPLSKAVLSGRVGSDRLLLPRTGELNARWLLGARATGLDVSTREVRLADGRVVGFDGLLVATGARARPWPDAGEAALRGVHLLRTRDDADRLRGDLVQEPRRVLVIGGGFTGSEVASSCHDLGLSVTVTQRGSAPMATALGGVVAAAIGVRQQACGIDLRARTTVTALNGDAEGRLTRARLSDGDVLDVDVAIVATGSVPNTEWLADSGLAADGGGVDCDSACRALDVTGAVVAGVYVAGDVARWRHPHFDAEPQSFEHWSNAVDQAELAAHNLIHEATDVRHNTALPAFWSDQFGMNIKSVGLPQVADQVVLTQGSFARGPFVAVYGRDGITVGAVAVNSPRVMDGYTALVAERAPFPPAINATDSPASVAVLDAGFARTTPHRAPLTLAADGGRS